MEEVGEVAEVLNMRSGRKKGGQDSNEKLSKELADVIHYTVAIATINRIDLTNTIFEKDKTAAVNYQHKHVFEGKVEMLSPSSNLRKSLERVKIKDKDF